MEEMIKLDISEETESFESLLLRLIAEKEGIEPKEVTISYIHQQREKRFYPTTRYDIGTESYGGYDSTGLTFFTEKEFEQIEEEVDRFLKNP